MSHHPRTASKLALPLTATSAISAGRVGAIPERLVEELGLRLAAAVASSAVPWAGASSVLVCVLAVSLSDRAFCGALLESLRGRNMTYALTNAEALNLGRQTGNQDAAAELLRMEGEWIVLIKICRSGRVQSTTCTRVVCMNEFT